MTDETKESLNKYLGKIYLRPFINSSRTLKTLEIDFGHFLSSLKWESIDKNSSEIPWFSYPSIEFLGNLDLKNKTLFEFGSGNSTIYWSKKVKFVTSVENNYIFYKKYNRLLNPKKVKYMFKKDKTAYIQSIRTSKPYDIIVVDGSYRNLCINESVKYLSKEGFIILDNSDRYKNICKRLRDRGLIQINFSGFGPINPYTTTTSFFINKNFSKIKHLNNKHIGSI